MNKKMHVDLVKCYNLANQMELFENILDNKLTAIELLNAFNAIEKQHDTPLLILYLNQIDYYACKRILIGIANTLEEYFRQALNHSGLIMKSEQAQKLLFSITDNSSNREIIRFSMTEKKFAINPTYPKNQADYDTEKKHYSRHHLKKESYYNNSINYLKNWIRDYEKVPYNHFSEVKKTYKKFGTLAALKTSFRKERTFANRVEKYQSNYRLLEIMVERLANLMEEQILLKKLDNDFELIQKLRPGINKSFILYGYEEADYKKMYKN